ALQGEHHAGSHAEGARRSRQDRRDHAGRRGRCRRGAGPVRRREGRRRRVGAAAAGRRRQVVRQILERPHGRDRLQIRRPSARELAADMKARGARTAAPRGAAGRPAARKVLVVDVGGTSVKILASGQSEHRSFPSGPKLTPRQMVSGVKKLAADWTYEVVSIGYPGPVLRGRPVIEPYNLGRAWVGFDYAAAFDRPVKVL